MNELPSRLPLIYPENLENWWMDRIFRFYRTRDSKTALKRQAPAAEKLSNLFTTERAPDFGDYTNEEEFLLAYGIYAFPQTYIRTSLVLRELMQLNRLPLAQEPELRMTDLGCGSGAASIAVLQFLQQNSQVERIVIQGQDKSRRSLELFSRILLEREELWPKGVQWQTKETTYEAGQRLNVGSAKQHLILLSFSMGEVFFGQPSTAAVDWIHPLHECLDENGMLLILEPALRETSIRLMALRDQLLLKGWQVLAPCPHAAACPMLKEGKYWCHEARSWVVPANLQRLNEHLKRSVHELKFSFLALRPPGTSTLPTLTPSRLVAPLAKVKGRYVTRVCSPGGQLQEWEIQTRTVEVEGRRYLGKIQRGDWAEATEKKPLTMPECYRLPNPAALKTQ